MSTPALIHLLNDDKNMEKQEAGLLESWSGLQLLQNCCLEKRNCYQSVFFFFFFHFTFSSPLQLKTLEDINIPPECDVKNILAVLGRTRRLDPHGEKGKHEELTIEEWNGAMDPGCDRRLPLISTLGQMAAVLVLISLCVFLCLTQQPVHVVSFFTPHTDSHHMLLTWRLAGGKGIHDWDVECLCFEVFIVLGKIKTNLLGYLHPKFDVILSTFMELYWNDR